MDKQTGVGWLTVVALAVAMMMPMGVLGQDVPDPPEPDPTELPPEEPLVL